MEETFFLSLEFLQVRGTFPLVEHLLSDMVTHLESDLDQLGRRGVEIEGGDVDVAKHGECQILFKDVMQASDGPASESISSEGVSVFIDEEVGSRRSRERQSELSMKFRGQIMAYFFVQCACFEVCENKMGSF